MLIHQGHDATSLVERRIGNIHLPAQAAKEHKCSGTGPLIGQRTTACAHRVPSSGCPVATTMIERSGAHALDLDRSSRDLSSYRQQLRYAGAVDIESVCLYRHLILQVPYLNCESHSLCGVRYI